MTIIKIISDKTNELSNKQKIIAKYLIENKDKIGFMTLKELSEEINVAEVTILNFCKNIGLESFTEMRRLFQELIKNELHVPEKLKTSLEDLDNVNDVFSNSIQIQKLNFEKAIQNNSIKTLQEISEIIKESRTVYICGMGISKVVAEYLNSRLKIINIDSKILDVGDLVSLSIELAKATEEDCFILISFPVYSKLIINLASYLNNNKFPFVSVTDSNKAPLAKKSKKVLISDNSSLVFYNSISATISLIEILLVVLSFNIKDRIIGNLKKLEEVQNSLSKDMLNN